MSDPTKKSIIINLCTHTSKFSYFQSNCSFFQKKKYVFSGSSAPVVGESLNESEAETNDKSDDKPDQAAEVKDEKFKKVKKKSFIFKNLTFLTLAVGHVDGVRMDLLL